MSPHTCSTIEALTGAGVWSYQIPPASPASRSKRDELQVREQREHPGPTRACLVGHSEPGTAAGVGHTGCSRRAADAGAGREGIAHPGDLQTARHAPHGRVGDGLVAADATLRGE